MPHIIVKLYPGRSEGQKKQLTQEITKNVIAITNCEDKAVSVAIEEVAPDEWADRVYKPDILDNQENLYKKPGYNPFD